MVSIAYSNSRMVHSKTDWIEYTDYRCTIYIHEYRPQNIVIFNITDHMCLLWELVFRIKWADWQMKRVKQKKTIFD